MRLTSEQKSQARETLFRHLDGLVITPTIASLHRHGVLKFFEETHTVALEDITAATGANEGYLQVALRLLCSQGWLVQDVNAATNTVKYTTTNRTRAAFELAGIFSELSEFLPTAARMDNWLFGEDVVDVGILERMVARHRTRWGLKESSNPDIGSVQKQALLQAEGILVGPILVALGMRGRLDHFADEQPAIGSQHLAVVDGRAAPVFDLFEVLGWIERCGAGYEATLQGLYALRRASAYGVTVSYLPMLQHVDELLFGDPNVIWRKTPEGAETHVDRTMNVWGSGGAHYTYFKKIDEIIVGIFSGPVAEQPRGIADMGCGNGAFLEHIFEVIWNKTERGQILAEHPIFVVGSDYNQAALEAAAETLEKADIWSTIILGDIGDPEQLAKRLESDHGIRLEDLLSVRSFLDHNRIYVEPDHIDPTRASRSTGAFSFRGRRLSNNAVEQNLVDHFRKWKPYVSKFGLLVLELHTIPPKLAALNVGRTNITAYDGTHGCSDQYILELEVFLDAAREAGLTRVPEYQTKYPPSDLATVSINLLRAVD